MNDIYVYSEPVHNFHFYYVWGVYYFQYVMLNLGGGGWISCYLWMRAGKAIKAYQHEPSVKQEESVVVWQS